jgi:hypothetical protein
VHRLRCIGKCHPQGEPIRRRIAAVVLAWSYHYFTDRYRAPLATASRATRPVRARGLTAQFRTIVEQHC